MEIDNFKEQFMKKIHITMAGAGKVLTKAEIVIIDEFVRLIKLNNLDISKIKK